MNLAELSKSRRAPREGDIFVVQPPDGQYLFGRVVDTNAKPFTVDVHAVLIYIYRVRSSVKTPVPELVRGQLLLAPMMTNKLPWSKGYFEHVENRPLSSMDRLPQHCFQSSYGRYFDEAGNGLPGPVEPVGRFALESYRTIDDAISEALGIPLSQIAGAAVAERVPQPRSVDVARADLAALQAAYVEAALTHAHASGEGNHRTANRAYERLSAVVRELRARGTEAQGVLLLLLDDERIQVRGRAAAHALELAPERACRVLEEIAAGPSSLEELAAKMMLQQWRNGTLRAP